MKLNTFLNYQNTCREQKYAYNAGHSTWVKIYAERDMI
jgi:hypothetical protein